MGKGNRSRIERAMTEANGVKPVKAKGKKVSGAGIFVAIAAILVVVALLVGAIGVLNDSGWFARSQTVVETDNYRVTGTMMNYFFMTQFNSYYEYYYQMYNSYFSNSYDSVYDLMGIDPNKSLKTQYMDAKEGEEKVTYFDYYMGLTEDYVTQMLTYCEFANKAGIELDEKDRESIDKSMENMKSSYESQKAMYEMYGLGYYNSYSAYLAATYGTGVTERDVRSALELITLAAKFEEKLNDEKEELLLNEKDYASIEEYVKNNPASFLMADYYAYSFSVSSKNYDNDADFEAAKKDILAQAQELSKSADKEAYKASVINMLKEAEKKAYREANWDKYLKENGNDETVAEQKMQEYFEKTYTTEYMDLKFKATFKEGYTYPTTHTDLSKWVFGYDASACEKGECEHDKEEDHEKSQEAAKAGTLTYFENTTTKEETVKKEETTTAATTTAPETTEGAAPASEETTKEETTTKAPSSTATEKVKVTTYTVTVYLLDKEAYRNTEITKHFGYVMFSKKADAEAFYTEFAKGEMNKDNLVEVLNSMYEQNNTLSIYAYDAVEDYMPGDLEDQKVTGADKWLETAKPGDCSGVIELTLTKETTNADKTTKQEKIPYYSVLVFDKDGYEAWFNDALAGAMSEAVKEWYEENGLELTYNAKAYKYIDM